MKKYPGYVVKISLWDRLVNWYYNWRYPLQGIDILKDVREDQAFLDHMYNMMVNKKLKNELAPINLTKPK